MPRLTVPPNFIGTTGSDSLIGEQLNVSVAIGIDILTGGFICTRSGKDTITGIATGTNDLEGSSNGGTGRGIANSGKLNAGDGEDTIAGTGTGGNGGKGIELAPGGDGGSAIGITNTGSLNTENRNDAIAGTGTGGNGGTVIGITNSGKLDTGEGGDTIIGTGTGGNTLKSANLTFNNNENSISLSTTGFEKFIFADSSFCYSTLANGA